MVGLELVARAAMAKQFSGVYDFPRNQIQM
jgi:hypothetical protein